MVTGFSQEITGAVLLLPWFPQHVSAPALPPPPGRPPKLPFLPGTGNGREFQREKGVSVEGTFKSNGESNTTAVFL